MALRTIMSRKEEGLLKLQLSLPQRKDSYRLMNNNIWNDRVKFLYGPKTRSESNVMLANVIFDL